MSNKEAVVDEGISRMAIVKVQNNEDSGLL